MKETLELFKNWENNIEAIKSINTDNTDIQYLKDFFKKWHLFNNSNWQVYEHQNWNTREFTKYYKGIYLKNGKAEQVCIDLAEKQNVIRILEQYISDDDINDYIDTTILDYNEIIKPLSESGELEKMLRDIFVKIIKNLQNVSLSDLDISESQYQEYLEDVKEDDTLSMSDFWGMVSNNVHNFSDLSKLVNDELEKINLKTQDFDPEFYSEQIANFWEFEDLWGFAPTSTGYNWTKIGLNWNIKIQ